ncbi:protein phosphatase 2C domain-containing protein [Tsukamurella sp. 8F]|uniref:protein phosphatase 2C domain-containing protein n=1 Tax=unclassified Tsukamurella TaxID=2633480 RepID=UPI0023B88C1A|nr:MULTISPECIES: protein phosphatase 2C domain-containing protein [unclassified Tsukamurella]MDF0529375.1 protein phosphatase 2C domain-containing protein [Tsukamurella sp. 8J]MDF0587118.1 protein phosphatase 2C domain-containing protein [Tsukamurella sp. 8F]
MSLILRYAARSDRGLVRSNNEDSVYAGPRLLALADGMGGHAAGEVASQLMITALAPLDDDEPGGDLLAKLDDAMRSGNESIADQVDEDPDLDGMGTTLTAILFAGSKLGLIHVGDSRGYLRRDSVITQITKDDTFVQTLVDEGRITAEQAHVHPQRSLIMKALTGHEVEPTLTLREAKAGDVYLLCSDGLSDVVSDETIGEALDNEDVAAAADRLIELALKAGGPDNVTVVVARVEDTSFGQSKPIVGGAVDDDDTDYVPPANTAAGRAAALRPPRQAPRRVIAQSSDDEPDRRRPRGRWIALAVLLALIIAAAVAAIVTRSIVRSNYFVAETSDGTVAISRGVRGSFFGTSLNDVQEVVCVAGGSASSATPGNSGCSPMRVADLTPSGRSNLRSLPDAASLDDAREQARALARNLMPVCAVSTLVLPPRSGAQPGAEPSGAAPTPAAPSGAQPSPQAPSESLTPGPNPSGAPVTTVTTQTSTPERPCRGGSS